MPVMDPNLVSPVTMMTPVTVMPRPLVSTPTSAVRQPTKLRRIEPKPLPGGDNSPLAPVASNSQAMTMPLTFVTVPQVPQQFHIQPTTLQQQQQLQAQQIQLQHQQLQIQSSPLQPQQAQHTPTQVTTHTSMMQSPQSIHIEISPQHQAQLLSPVPQPTPPPPQQQQQQSVAQVQQTSQQQTHHTPTSKKEEKRKEKHTKNHQQHHENLVKEVKEEYDA